jgi:uncharacterized phage protein gp47/JayE
MTTEVEVGLIPRGRKAYSQIEYSALSRETIEQALIDYVKANFPEQRDFVESAGFSIVTREIAYVADLLSYRADYLANNSYLPTATNLRALDNLLSLIGYRRSSVQPASTDVVIVPQQTIGNPNDPAESSFTVRIPAKTTIQGVGKSGNPVSFELFAGSTNIFDDIEIPAGSANVLAYAVEGVSKTVTVKSNGERFQQVYLSDLDVIQDTIRVNTGIYDSTDAGLGTLYNPNLPQWERVDYVVTHQQENIFELRLRPDGTTVLSFGDGTFGNTVPKDHDIIINYRTGGGDNGNVLPQGLNGSGNFSIFNGGLRTPNNIGCAMTNVSRGVGGRDEEGIEEAKFLAPLVYQTQQRAVKAIDFTALALKHPKVFKCVSVSRQEIVLDSFEDPTEWSFPLAATQPYTISLDVHRLDLRTTQNFTANVRLSKTTYTDPSELVLELNTALGWTYDQTTLAFRPTVLNEQFIGHFDLAIEGYIEFWIDTGTYQSRVTVKGGGNALLPILRIPAGDFGRVDSNYVDVHILTYADDGNVSVPNTALVNELRTYFDKYKEIQTEVTVRRGFIQRVDLNGNVYLDKTADPIQIKAKVQEAVDGIFDAKSRELGEPFYVSKLYEAIEKISGVAYVDEFLPSQNVFPDSRTLLQLGSLNILFYEAKQ